MARPTTAEYLSSVPASVRRNMLDAGLSLEPGSAAVVGRFFQALKDSGEPYDNPSAAVFTQAARSESTLATLLRSLAIYAPQVSTAAGRELRREYYARRPVSGNQLGKPRSTTPSQPPAVAPASWPLDWRLMYVGLIRNSGIKPSSLKRHFASIDRCASVLSQTDADGALNFYTAYCLAERFREIGIKHKTIAGYLGGLVSLGKHGGAQESDLDGIRVSIQYHLELAEMEAKEKEPRLRSLIEKGGFEYIATVIARLRARIDEMPGHSSETQKLRQTIVLLAIHMNKPARAGDAAAWRLGQDLVRHRDGAWMLEWRQEKSGVETAAGRLWDEVSEILDLHILAGRPDRLVHLRYDELQGMNWLTLETGNADRKLLSLRIKDAIGVPSHDLRTLTAEYLRNADPRRAPDIIQTHLGHGTLKAGEAYRLDCESDVAAQVWLEIKRDIARGKLAS